MYVAIWEFRARLGQEAAFERAYGPEGEWVKLFRSGEGYLGTELLRSGEGTYLTVDRWVSREAYEAFRDGNRPEYDMIDRQCESFTEHETLLGTYVRLD